MLDKTFLEKVKYGKHLGPEDLRDGSRVYLFKEKSVGENHPHIAARVLEENLGCAGYFIISDRDTINPLQDIDDRFSPFYVNVDEGYKNIGLRSILLKNGHDLASDENIILADLPYSIEPGESFEDYKSFCLENCFREFSPEEIDYLSGKLALQGDRDQDTWKLALKDLVVAESATL